jgi:hypothetical protein
LAALPVRAELRQAAVRVESLRRRPEARRGDSPSAATARGVLLVATVTLALAQEAGEPQPARLRHQKLTAMIFFGGTGGSTTVA